MAARCEKLAQGFYTAATWPGIEPRICDTLVRRSTSKPPSHLYNKVIFFLNGKIKNKEITREMIQNQKSVLWK